MLLVMTAEAAREIRMADVVRIEAPGDVHVGKNVAVIDCQHALGGACDLALKLGVGRRIGFAVAFLKGGGNLDRRLGAAAVGLLHQFEADLLGERQRGRDGAVVHRIVDGALGKLVGVRGPVVAVHAVHLAQGRAGAVELGRRGRHRWSFGRYWRR